MIYSFGVDVSKDEYSVCLLGYNLSEQTYKVQARKTFGNRPGGHKAFLRWLRSRTKSQPAPIRMSMEATGIYYESLALFIQKNCPQIHLSVVLPSKSKRYIKSRGLRSKTDKIDAFGLALMGAERRLSQWRGIDPFWRNLRQLTRTRAALMDQPTQLRNQLHALTHSGQAGGQAEAALQETIRALSQQIDQLTQLIYKKLRARKDLKASIERLRSIPGIGLLTIANILAETNGFDRFESIAQLISYSGYDVVIKESGKWAGKPHISKEGSKYIRRAMYMPVGVSIRAEEGPIHAFYQRQLDKHNIKMKAHVAVQKKLLTYMYTLWNNGQQYNPEVIRADRQSQGKKVVPPKGKATVDTSYASAL